MSFPKSEKIYSEIFTFAYSHLGPRNIPEVKCFLESIERRGLTLGSNSDVISDNTYSSDKQGWQKLKTDIQTECKSEKFKRELLRALRRMYDEDEDEKKK